MNIIVHHMFNRMRERAVGARKPLRLKGLQYNRHVADSRGGILEHLLILAQFFWET
jgi:hypothetical protein